MLRNTHAEEEPERQSPTAFPSFKPEKYFNFSGNNRVFGTNREHVSNPQSREDNGSHLRGLSHRERSVPEFMKRGLPGEVPVRLPSFGAGPASHREEDGMGASGTIYSRGYASALRSQNN